MNNSSLKTYSSKKNFQSIPLLDNLNNVSLLDENLSLIINQNFLRNLKTSNIINLKANQKHLKHAINIRQICHSLDGANPIMAIIDMNSVIHYSSNDFDKYFNNGETAFSKLILTLQPFQANYKDIESILTQTFVEQKKTRVIIFIKIKGGVCPHIIEILPIINPLTKDMVGITLIMQKYEEQGLLFQRLKQKNFTMGSKTPKRSINSANLLSKLTQFQITICYLAVHNYPNEHIAEIINLLDETHVVKKTSRSSINKQIDKIREIFKLNSKAELIDFLAEINFYNYLPTTLFNEGVCALD